MMILVPFGNEINLSNEGLDVECISECKMHMLLFQGIISGTRWKGFHGAQLKEKGDRKEIDLRFLSHLKKNLLEDMLLQCRVPSAVMRNGEWKRTAASSPVPVLTF